MTLPTASLRIHCAMTNPPKPLGIDIIVKGRPVAVATLDDLRRAMIELEGLESAISVPVKP
jgi:hypothetical protein